MNLLREAREAAVKCPDLTKRRILRERTDALQDILGQFAISVSREDMLTLVGAWSRVIIALDALPPLPEHGPKGGRQSIPAKKKSVEAKSEVG